MTNIKYTIDRSRESHEYIGTFESTRKPTDSEIINTLDRNNFGGSVGFLREIEPNVWEFVAEVWVN